MHEVTMGFSLRIFFIDEDDNIQQIPHTRYQKLVDSDPAAAFPEYGNIRIRCAEIVVEFENRAPVGIARENYSYMKFDADGNIDRAYADEMGRVLAEIIGGMPLPDDPKNLVRASGRLAVKRFQEKYTWTPTGELEQALFKRALK
jgi:hypothetical protein